MNVTLHGKGQLADEAKNLEMGESPGYLSGTNVIIRDMRIKRKKEKRDVTMKPEFSDALRRLRKGPRKAGSLSKMEKERKRFPTEAL